MTYTTAQASLLASSLAVKGVYMYVYVDICECFYVCFCVFMCMNVCVCIHVCMYVCMDVYMYAGVNAKCYIAMRYWNPYTEEVLRIYLHLYLSTVHYSHQTQHQNNFQHSHVHQ